jgi:YesN/AraC family two-component response regulator
MRAPRFLFVDDEPNIRVTLPMILKQEGFDVTTAATVPEALEYIAKQKFDVLLSDLNIGQPGDGFTVVSAMRRTQPEAVTLILTGYPDFETALQALRDQVDDYLTKPADIKYLIELIKQKLASPHPKLPPQVKRVSTVLRENANLIMQEWFEAILLDRDISQVDLSKKERINHMPVLLRELADRMDSEQFESNHQTRETARKHGRQRREDGYGVAEIVGEGHDAARRRPA